MTVKDIITNYCKEKNLTLRMFAMITGIQTQAIYNWFRGRNGISALYAHKIEKATQGSIKYEMLTDKPKNKRLLKRK